MNRPLRIAVADDEPDMQEYLRETLTRMGHEVVCAVGDGRTLVRECRALHPDLVITDVRMPELDGLDAARELCREELIPVVIVTAYHDREAVEKAVSTHILAYLVKPIREHDLGPAISIAMKRHEEWKTLAAEAADLRQALEDRKVIEKAKGLLMREAELDEETAFRRLQKLASASNYKLAQLARMIVETAAAFRREGPGPPPPAQPA